MSSLPRVTLRRWAVPTVAISLLVIIWTVNLARLHPASALDLASDLQSPPESTPPPAAGVALVLTTLKNDNVDWTTSITNKTLQVIRYVADDYSAPYHPVVNRGNEAMVILTYLYEFYDKLPDVSIFTHSEDGAWHNDALLEGKNVYTIDHLDLEEVKRRGYANLIIRCPEATRTNVTYENGYDPIHTEEPFMAQAFQANFPGDEVPDILSAPCCSQFAVSREAVRSNEREQYQRHIDWLRKSELTDHLLGRLWEHLWQFLFLGMAVDCPDEYRTMCRQYHICFESAEEMHSWYTLSDSLQRVEEEMSRERLGDGAKETWKVNLETQRVMLDETRGKAIERGKTKEAREKIVGNL